MSSNFSSGTTISSIYKVLNWTEIDDPNNDFNPATGIFIAPETGIYKITITATSIKLGYLTFHILYGLVDQLTGRWILRFTIPYEYVANADTNSGAASTFVG